MSERTEKIKKLWDKASNDYDIHMDETNHYRAQENLLGYFSAYFTSPVLDLAAGPGFLAEKISNLGYEITLNDFSAEMVKLASGRFSHNSNLSFSNQDAHVLSFETKFKTILCCNLFYYLDDRMKAVDAWGRLLSEGGRIILFEEYPFQKPQTEEMSEHENELMNLIDPLTPDQIKFIFTKAGYVLVDERKEPIDKRHDLFGYVFERRS